MAGVTRRSLLKGAAMAAAATRIPGAMAQGTNVVMPGKFQPTWESLKQWRMPEWFRDAKFGIWAHWSAQCVPEQGDWYARRMYMQGDHCYDFHVKNYGHPTKVGFKEIDHMWKAERWEPEKLLDLYVKTGAKYFMALACHHDNLDCFDSTHHAWNTMKVGPKKDIIGTWEKLVRARGLRFSVSNHSSHAWHWFQTAYGYDPEGPLAGQRYDAYTLTKADGKGQWWDGLDPQELYTGRNMVMPDGIKTIAEANAWHKQNDGRWLETVPPANPEFVRTWFLRCKELIDKYKPDMLYLDDEELPLGQAGLDLVAHFYNASAKWHNGETQAVVSAKEYTKEHMGATMLDIERGRAQGIMEAPWQTDTCIGDWHYKRSLYTEHKYKTPEWVAQALVDIVSKNGNLMLNIPVRGDGTIDEDEYKFLDEFGRWMRVHGEGIYGTRPFKIYGEGLPDAADSHNFNENKGRKFDASDIRFTTKGDTLYLFALGWPESGKLKVKSLAKGNTLYPRTIRGVEMLGGKGRLQVTQDADGLEITLPARPADQLSAFGFKVLS
ncbi:alpha-L-fucosidase [Edaphobacter flagellatus]|uniref:alpha-L-fucosidase n=1 Tax=Edaphobacter flagellatus TaxID=1933044 RepID=UPI0021B1D3F6|nr:alpha-L-fucosidase [Edaphobacter flagellatus]